MTTDLAIRITQLELGLARLRMVAHGACVYVGEGLTERAATRLVDLVAELEAAAVEARALATVARCDAAVPEPTLTVYEVGDLTAGDGPSVVLCGTREAVRSVAQHLGRSVVVRGAP